MDNIKFKPYSYSKISTFNSCPYKFKLQYIDKLKVPQNLDALIKGTTIHYCLENNKLNYNNYSEGMKNNIKRFPEVLEIVENFKKSELGIKYLNNIKKEPIQEYRLGLNENLSNTNYNKTALFYGIVDYICILENNNIDLLHLCDFKSGKYKEPKYQDYNQLLFYSIYFFEKYKIKNIKITFIYVEHNIENELLLDICFLDNYKKELLNNIYRIENETEFDKNKTILCKWSHFYKVKCDSTID